MKNQLGYLLYASIYPIHSIRFIRGQDPLDHLAYTRLSDKRICWDIKNLIGCCADNSVYQLRQSLGARRYLDWSCSHYSSRRLVFGRVPDDPSPSLLFHNGGCVSNVYTLDKLRMVLVTTAWLYCHLSHCFSARYHVATLLTSQFTGRCPRLCDSPWMISVLVYPYMEGLIHVLLCLSTAGNDRLFLCRVQNLVRMDMKVKITIYLWLHPVEPEEGVRQVCCFKKIRITGVIPFAMSNWWVSRIWLVF